MAGIILHLSIMCGLGFPKGHKTCLVPALVQSIAFAPALALNLRSSIAGLVVTFTAAPCGCTAAPAAAIAALVHAYVLQHVGQSQACFADGNELCVCALEF